MWVCICPGSSISLTAPTAVRPQCPRAKRTQASASWELDKGAGVLTEITCRLKGYTSRSPRGLQKPWKMLSSSLTLWGVEANCAVMEPEWRECRSRSGDMAKKEGISEFWDVNN
jgi:hypothetical protein